MTTIMKHYKVYIIWLQLNLLSLDNWLGGLARGIMRLLETLPVSLAVTTVYETK